MITDEPTPCQDNPQPFDDVLDKASPENVHRAQAICAGCDRRDPCLAYALKTQAVGVYGGNLIGVTPIAKPTKPAPVCVNCGEVRRARPDRQRWAGSRGMCDGCYQAWWRAEIRERVGVSA